MRRSPVKFVIFGMFLLGLWGCERQTPKLSDDEIQKVRRAFPGITDECIAKIRLGGIEGMPMQVDQCFTMMPRQRWRGLWRNGFEGSLFCPAPAGSCPASGFGVWLTFRGEIPSIAKKQRDEVYVVDFWGRRTSQKGHYAHGGIFEHEMIVDDLISIRLIDDSGA